MGQNILFDNPLPVSLTSGSAITKTDISGTITTGNTAQQLIDANASGVMFEIQNVSGGDLWINEVGADAVKDKPSFKIVDGGYYVTDSPITTAVSIIGATTGQKFTARKW